MAIRYAVASGNWSSTSTWDGGTLPGSGDDVYANNKTVYIDQSISVKSLRRTANTTPAITVGGTFQVITNATLTITDGITATEVSAAGSSFLTVTRLVTPTSPITVTLNGGIAGGSINSSRGIQLLNAAHTLTVNGNVTAGTATNAQAINGGSGATDSTVTVTGNVTGPSASTSAAIANVKYLTVTGAVTGGSTYYAIDSSGTGAQVTVHGSITGGATSAGNGGFAGIRWGNGSALRIDAAMRYGADGAPPVVNSGNAVGPMFVRGGADLAMIAASDDNWPLDTGAEITLGEGGSTGRYTLAVGDSAVTAG